MPLMPQCRSSAGCLQECHAPVEREWETEGLQEDDACKQHVRDMNSIVMNMVVITTQQQSVGCERHRAHATDTFKPCKGCTDASGQSDHDRSTYTQLLQVLQQKLDLGRPKADQTPLNALLWIISASTSFIVALQALSKSSSAHVDCGRRKACKTLCHEMHRMIRPQACFLALELTDTSLISRSA